MLYDCGSNSKGCDNPHKLFYLIYFENAIMYFHLYYKKIKCFVWFWLDDSYELNKRLKQHNGMYKETKTTDSLLYVAGLWQRLPCSHNVPF